MTDKTVADLKAMMQEAATEAWLQESEGLQSDLVSSFRKTLEGGLASRRKLLANMQEAGMPAKLAETLVRPEEELAEALLEAVIAEIGAPRNGEFHLYLRSVLKGCLSNSTTPKPEK